MSTRTTTTPASHSATLLPILLTAFAVAFGAALAAFFPMAMVALYLGIAPIALLLVWVARDVPYPLERIAAFDAAHHVHAHVSR